MSNPGTQQTAISTDRLAVLIRRSTPSAAEWMFGLTLRSGSASWDTQLANTYGVRIATELRTLGYAEGLSGGVSLAREPRDGRTFEYMGEDPVLAGVMSAARTAGTQSQKVIATSNIMR